MILCELEDVQGFLGRLRIPVLFWMAVVVEGKGVTLKGVVCMVQESREFGGAVLKVVYVEGECLAVSYEIALENSQFLVIDPIPSQRKEVAEETEGVPSPHQESAEEMILEQKNFPQEDPYLNLNFSWSILKTYLAIDLRHRYHQCKLLVGGQLR